MVIQPVLRDISNFGTSVLGPIERGENSLYLTLQSWEKIFAVVA